MSTKSISIRLAAEGGKKIKAEFQSVGKSGERNLRRVSTAAERASIKLRMLSDRVKIVGRVIGVALAVGAAAALRSSLATVDAQAKLAASLRTTTESIQILTRAGDLAGVSMGQVEQATIQLTKRLSQAVTGTGPAVGALDALNLSAKNLSEMPLDERITAIQDAISKFIPKAEQAATASQIFGDRAGLIFTRIDSATLRQATADVKDFGVAVSEQDAAQIQTTNDALSRMGLLWSGIANRIAVAVAPAMEAMAKAMANFGKVTGPLGVALKGFGKHIGEISTIAATFASVIGGKLVLKLGAAVLGISKATTALGLLRGAIIRTGIGALIIGAGELVYQFGELSKGSGGFGEAMGLLKDVAVEVWDRIKMGGQSLADALSSVYARIKAGWLTVLADLQKGWSDFLHTVTRGLANVPGMDAPMLAVGNAAIMAGTAWIEMRGDAEAARAAADGLVSSSQKLAAAALAPLKSMQALRDAMKQARDGNGGGDTPPTVPPRVYTPPTVPPRVAAATAAAAAAAADRHGQGGDHPPRPPHRHLRAVDRGVLRHLFLPDRQASGNPCPARTGGRIRGAAADRRPGAAAASGAVLCRRGQPWPMTSVAAKSNGGGF